MAEVLGLRGGGGGKGGRLGLWARGSVSHGVGSDPCRQSPCPREKATGHWSGAGAGYLGHLVCNLEIGLQARLDSGRGTDKLSLPHRTGPQASPFPL